MRQLTVKEFRNELSDIFNRLAYAGEGVIVTRHGKPVGMMVPVDQAARLDQKTSTDSSDHPKEGT